MGFPDRLVKILIRLTKGSDIQMTSKSRWNSSQYLKPFSQCIKIPDQITRIINLNIQLLDLQETSADLHLTSSVVLQSSPISCVFAHPLCRRDLPNFIVFHTMTQSRDLIKKMVGSQLRSYSSKNSTRDQEEIREGRRTPRKTSNNDMRRPALVGYLSCTHLFPL